MDHRAKIKENKKTDKYLDFAGVQKKTWDMRRAKIATIVDMLETVLKGFNKRLKRLETS